MNVLEGGSKRLWLSVPWPVFFRHKRPEPGRCRPDSAFTCVYNFGALSPICENSSSRPALCCVLSEQTDRHGVTFVPGAKTDAIVPVLVLFVHESLLERHAH